jgi:hypothetical protein
MMDSLRKERESRFLTGPATDFIEVSDETCPHCGGDPKRCYEVREYDPSCRVGAIVCKKTDRYIRHTDAERWAKQ